MNDKGRLDWRPRLKVWSAILYKGKVDVEIGRYPTWECAAAALQTAIRRRGTR